MEIQWSLVLFTLLTGTAGWMFVCLAIDEFIKKYQETTFRITLIALIVAIVGGIASVTHLSHPDRMLNALQHPTSGIFVEAVLVGCVAVFAIIYLILIGRKASPRARQVFAIITAVFGVVLSFMAGQSYMMESRESWYTWLLPLGYMGTAIPCGVSAYIMLASAMKKESNVKPYAGFLAIGGAVALITSCAYILSEGLLSFDITWQFVLIILGSGVVPIVLGVVIYARPRTAFAGSLVSLICALAGGLLFRCIMWMTTEAVVNLFGTVI